MGSSFFDADGTGASRGEEADAVGVLAVLFEAASVEACVTRDGRQGHVTEVRHDLVEDGVGDLRGTQQLLGTLTALDGVEDRLVRECDQAHEDADGHGDLEEGEATLAAGPGTHSLSPSCGW